MPLRLLLLAATAAFAAGPAWATPPQVGSGNEAVIEPPVPHPAETPCTVPLVVNAQFADFNPALYTYTPPAACPGPWAKVVLQMNLSLNAGIQFDRTGLLVINGVPLWFGTTAEPDTNLGPSWSFQKDVTDETALFEAAQSGSLSIGNVVNGTYTSTITASATLLFYPPTAADPAPLTADVVLPLPSTGGTGTLNTGADTISSTMVFPRNVLNAKLDLYLQGQSSDEFWYTCVPNSVTGVLESCGNGALREGEVSVDGTPAGVAPVFPWIFTGGIDPYLWQPIPGVQTLDFTPFTLDLSPFAGVLSDGNSHTIAASVFGANSYFQATGALRLFLDHAAPVVTGGLTQDTLQPLPTVQTTQNVNTSSGVTLGLVNTADIRDFTIVGTVTGSAGTTTNTVSQSTSFTNDQSFTITGTTYTQKIKQKTVIDQLSTAQTGTISTTEKTSLTWPLSVAYSFGVNANGAAAQRSTISMQYNQATSQIRNGATTVQGSLTNGITTNDTLLIDNQGYIVGNQNQSEIANYLVTGSNLPCFERTLTAAANILTSATTGCAQ